MNKTYLSSLAIAISSLSALSLWAETDAVLEQAANHHLHIGDYANTGPAGYTPAQIRHAYGFDRIAHTGAGQKIAIIDAYGSPTIQNDLNAFCKYFGLPQTTVQIYYPNGKPTKTDSGWALETSLDVEWAHAIAPGATIILVVSKDATLGNLLNAVDYAVQLGAKQISMSWGATEFPTETAYDLHFNKTNVTFTASSGDNGAGVSWPAVSPYVVAVGGTTLSLNASGNVLSEVAWTGSGGGTSAYVSKPAYQAPFQYTTKRMVPDVSYNANPATGFPVYDSTPYSGRSGWFTVGGTSAGAPQWAALIALANCSTIVPVTQTDTPLYRLGAPNIRSLYFRDIISGNNGRYNALIGYDEVTGLGSPLSNTMVPALVH